MAIRMFNLQDPIRFIMRFHAIKFFARQSFHFVRSDKNEFLLCKILSDLIKNQYRVRPDKLSYKVLVRRRIIL